VGFEQFKTQVLLLHSEQSTLDSLSTGFGERYSVHCATSGTEALNTLGATPIDVIVSAQKLPGMSGLDALREAKKRSPETITILMAGSGADDGLEALVSDKEVFQIIRGEIEPQKLCELVEYATKTARLMALADSANDTSADVDEPGEHIIMETADNGSFIVSDGTGQLPVLKPEKINPGADARRKQVDLLVLTQDDEFLATVRESTRGMHKVHHAAKPGQAEDFVRNFPVGVIVTDAGLAGANVEALTQRLRAHRARLVAIVAGRRDDGEMLMDLINRGQVYRFLLKPVSPGRARLAIEASVKYHLEAPEQAFKGRPGPRTPNLPPAPKPQAKTAPAKPAAAPARPAQAREAARPAPTPKQATSTPGAKAAPGKQSPAPAPVSDVLDDAFGDTTSFTETMTGIAISVGKSLSSAAKSLTAGKAKPQKKPEPEAKAEPKARAPAKPGPQPAARPETRPAAEPRAQPRAAARPAARPDPAAKAGPKPRAAAKPGQQPQPTARPKPQPQAAANSKPQPQAAAEPRAQPAANPEGRPDTRKAAEAGIKADPTSAAAASIDQISLTGPGDSGSVLSVRNLAIAAGVLVAIGASYILLTGGDDVVAPPPVADSVEEPAATADAGEADNAADAIRASDPAESGVEQAAAGTRDAVQETPAADARTLLERARTARAEGAVYAPAGNNAVELLVAARDAAPADAEVAAELDVLIEEVFGQAETALMENRTQDASRALRVIGLAAPESPRLNFLDSQLRQQELRAALDDARDAIRDGRFEDAGRELGRAETFAGGSTAEIDELSGELAAARDSQQLDDVLSEARDRLESDRLIAPANDNARYFFELARSIDPESTAAQQGLVSVANKLVLRARAAIDSGDFRSAEALLADAREMDPRSDEVAAAAEALRVARTPPPPASPRAAPAAVEAEASGGQLAEPAAEPPATAAATRPQDDSPASAPDQAAAPGADLVSISALKRTKYVGPQYPRAAKRRNLSGYVDIVFTVMPDGGVADLSVRESEPGDVFVDAALDAVEQWEFEPVIEDGVAVPKRVAVRMSFSLQ
jgi:serine/threonine-protein kinase